MKNYMIITEGPHDVAVIEMIFKLELKCTSVKNINNTGIWEKLFDIKYPFKSDLIYGGDNIAHVPVIMANDDISVAIFSAGGIGNITKKLKDTYDMLELRDFASVEKVLFACDVDDKIPRDVIKRFTDELNSLGIETTKKHSNYVLSFSPLIQKDLSIYLFPDNAAKGAIEDILLSAGEINYADIKKSAKEYLDTVRKSSCKEIEIDTNRYFNKAWVGVISNVMCPGKANQISIHDKSWITADVIRDCGTLKTFSDYLYKFCCG